MGRKSKRRWNNNSNQQKKRKKGNSKRFWIEDCPDTELPADSSGRQSIDVLITRVELEDSYQQTPVVASSGSNEKRSDVTADNKVKDAMEEVGTKLEGADEPQATKEASGGDKEPRYKELMAETETCSLPPAAAVFSKEQDTKSSESIASSREERRQDVDKSPSVLVMIKRTKSAKRKLERFFPAVDNFKPLPNGDCGDGILNPYPKSDVPDKFWAQRKRLFSRFDDGIQLDNESWYSVTPEAIANHIAASMVTNKANEKLTILDLFCGCGGNAIAFARREEVQTVVCVDKDMQKLEKAAHNAKCYGVDSKKMLFIHGHAGEVLDCYKGGDLIQNENREKDPESLKDSGSGYYYRIGGLSLLPSAIDMAFLSPPWGGMDYGKVGKRNYTLNSIEIEETGGTLNGETLLERVGRSLGHRPTVLFLPKNVNGTAIGKSAFKAGYVGSVVLEQNVLNGKLKTVTGYLGID